MIAIQTAALLILAFHYGLSWNFSNSDFLRHAGVLFAASWVAEESCLVAYDFYHYHPQWWGMIDRMPLMISAIWPAVILSAISLASAWKGPKSLWVGVIVFFDAALIEPIAVQTGLWTWHEPGLFQVPPIGVLGWAFFASASVFLLDFRKTLKQSPLWDWAVVIVAPLFTHLALLVSWWLFFKSISIEIDAWWGIAVFALLSLGLTLIIGICKLGQRLRPRDLFLRLPAALFFFALVLIFHAHRLDLMLYVSTFIPPYLALSWQVLRA